MYDLSYSSPVLFDSRGHRRTASLFYEVSQDQNNPPLYTLKDHAFKGLPSVYELYMGAADEYEAAIQIVGSMAHWRKLEKCKWFMDGDVTRGVYMGLRQWRQDMDARDASRARRTLMTKLAEEDLQAAKYLHTYATKGDRAGVKETKESKAPARRGVQTEARVIDLEARFENIKDLD